MPRLAISTIRSAYSHSRYLPLLLSVTRDLESAKNELRWLSDYVQKVKRLTRLYPEKYPQEPPSLSVLCHERATGRPLQYILGSQPFGDLEIVCGKGVLIPRPETEAYTTRLSNLISSHYETIDKAGASLRLLDICAGSGCIGLSLFASLHKRFEGLSIKAIDISSRAQKFAQKTVKLNQKLNRLPLDLKSSQFEYILVDVLDSTAMAALDDSRIPPYDIIVSNPPYISVRSLSKDTSRSARYFEPRNALVPSLTPLAARSVTGEATGDVFYAHILRIAAGQQAKIVLMEVADTEQALRVLKIVEDIQAEHDGEPWNTKQIWCDGIDVYRNENAARTILQNVKIIGDGHGRAVVLSRGWGASVLEAER